MKLHNPYVGPRAFEEEDSRNFFGRKEETRQLASLVIAHRVVLLYAPSGAGKTSLLSAGLVPYLKQRKRVNILPIARVGGDLPPDVDGTRVKNIYVFNILLDLVGEESHSDALIDRSLSEGLAAHFTPQSDQRRPRPCLLIVDQFEELFTTHPERYPERADFFFQLQNSLKNHSQLSLLLSMREDYIAQLSSYAAQMPDRLRTRFRLELLGEAAARQAVQEPAHQVEVDFTDAAAEKLVNDLRKVQVQQPDGTITEQLGRHIEPVQLQVVCRRLWGKLPEDAEQIGETDVEAVGNVDTALSDYYADRVKTSAENTGVRERAIREWFERQLITEQGIRGQVLKGPEQSQGLENQAIAPLVDAHLVRAEKRLNAIWYELAHDRLIEPVRNNNAKWFRAHLSPLQRQADLWESQSRSSGLLLRENALVEAETWATEHNDELIPVEREFLTACRKARAQARRERLRNHFIQGLAVVATMLLCVAGYALWAASRSAWQARLSELDAQEKELKAKQAQKEAERRSFISIAQSLIAYAHQQAAEGDREQAALLVRQAYFLNQRYQGDVIEQIDNALRLILRTPETDQSQDINKSAAALVEQVCQKVKFKLMLTPKEWKWFVGHSIPYEPCPERIEPDATARIHPRSEGITAYDPLTLSLNLYEESGRWYPKRRTDNVFEDRGGVVVDRTTGLMWEKSGSEEMLIYADAQEYIEILNRERFAGYDDWRLPTIPELMSLLALKRQSNGLYIHSIFDATQESCWSVDIRTKGKDSSSSFAWFVMLDQGYVDLASFKDNHFIRCVRWAAKRSARQVRLSDVSIAQSLIEYALQQNAEGDREQAALLARQAYFLNQRYQGDVIEQIDNALRLILRTPETDQSQDINKSAAALVEQVCQKVKFKLMLTPEEWKWFVGRDIPYEPCPERIEPDKTVRIHLRSEGMTTDDPLALSLNLYGTGGWGYPKRYVDNDFEDRGEVVVDHATGLMWEKSGSEEMLIYADAQEYVEILNRERFAGYDDWRLPTIPELMSLLEPKRQSNGLCINPIFDATQRLCWSVDIRIKGKDSFSGLAWFIMFDQRYVRWVRVKYLRYVRCVRSSRAP